MKLTPFKSLCLMLTSTAFATHAAINLDRTRIVFPESDKASSLKVDNQSKVLPYLALSWIEDEKGQKEDTHFMALPPIQRIEAGTSSQIRIVKQATTRQLPGDRESLFYFNLAMQSRIKLFWRPEAISKKSGELTEMRMEISANADGLTVHNPTPYYITLAWLSKNAKTMLPGFDSLMIAPFATATASTGDYHGSYYSIGYIDDYGALKKVDVQCTGTALCKLTERKIDKDAKAR